MSEMSGRYGARFRRLVRRVAEFERVVSVGMAGITGLGLLSIGTSHKGGEVLRTTTGWDNCTEVSRILRLGVIACAGLYSASAECKARSSSSGLHGLVR